MSLSLLNAGNVSQFNTQVDQLISQILQAESKPKQQLEERKTSLSSQKEIFDQVSSSLANLQSKADALDGTFDRRVTESSNPSIVDVSAGSDARPGSYELTVQQLAQAHTLASHQIPSNGLNLLDFFGPGERRFTILAQGQRVTVTFEIPETLEETGQAPTNQDILRIISDAIRQANAKAGLGQSGFSAEAIRDTATSTRLIVKSNQTGSANQLYFEDPEGVLSVLGLNPNVKAEGINGGWIHGAEGQNKIRDEVLNFFNPIADLSPQNVPAMAQQLGALANVAAHLTDGEGQPLAQSLSNVIRLLTDNSDILDDPQLQLAFDSIADLVDRVDDQAVRALATEFLRRAGELRGPQPEGTVPLSVQLQTPNSALAAAFESLAQGIQLLGQGADTDTAFEGFRTALADLTTQDRTELLQQFNQAVQGLNALCRKEGDELTTAFYEMIQPLFDLTIDERTSVAVQFFNIADVAASIDSPGAASVAEEFQALGDLVEGLSQPLADPLETPYASLYAVFYVLPADTKAELGTELNHFAAQLDDVGKGQVAEVFRHLAGAVSDPDIETNFSSHFNDFATALGALNLEDRTLARQELASFTEQIARLVPPGGQADLIAFNFQAVTHSIDDLNTFQAAALQDQMMAVTEAIDGLNTDDRSVVREEMVRALQGLRSVLPIEMPEGMEASFAAFNGAANDLSQEDRNILSAELARFADSTQLGRAFDALAQTAFGAGEPGAFDSHKQEFLWRLGALDEDERQEFTDALNAVADRLPGLIGEDSVRLVPILRETARLAAQPIVFETPAAQFLSALDSAASATGTFNETEIQEINRYLPELAEVLANNVSDRRHDLVQSLFNAGQTLAQLSPGAQETLKTVLQQMAANLGQALTGPDAQEIPQQLNALLDAIDAIDNYQTLDARFTLDGIPITRSSNTVGDLIDGVTLRLNNLTNPNASDPASRSVRIKIDTDLDGMTKDIQDFLTAYNETIKLVEDQTRIDSETSTRAALAGDRDYLLLRMNLRRAINDPITLGDGLSFLKSIGISIGTGASDNNQIRLDNPESLRQALSSNLSLVQALLTDSQSGAASRVSRLMDDYLSSDGVLAKDKALIDRNVEQIDDRLDVLNTRMDSRESYLRTEYNNIAEQLLSLSSQTQALQGFFGSSSGLL
jgi:flagellar capping protein FliD